jgi:hypothetical protein
MQTEEERIRGIRTHVKALVVRAEDHHESRWRGGFFIEVEREEDEEEARNHDAIPAPSIPGQSRASNQKWNNSQTRYAR